MSQKMLGSSLWWWWLNCKEIKAWRSCLLFCWIKVSSLPWHTYSVITISLCVHIFNSKLAWLELQRKLKKVEQAVLCQAIWQVNAKTQRQHSSLLCLKHGTPIYYEMVKIVFYNYLEIQNLLSLELLLATIIIINWSENTSTSGYNFIAVLDLLTSSELLLLLLVIMTETWNFLGHYGIIFWLHAFHQEIEKCFPTLWGSEGGGEAKVQATTKGELLAPPEGKPLYWWWWWSSSYIFSPYGKY